MYLTLQVVVFSQNEINMQNHVLSRLRNFATSESSAITACCIWKIANICWYFLPNKRVNYLHSTKYFAFSIFQVFFRETAKRLNKVPMDVYTLSQPGSSDISSTYRGYI